VSARYVFVDRDGTLVADRGYVHRIEDYRLLPGAAAGLLRLQEAGFAIAIVTNQSGIGRGHYSEADFQRFQDHLVADLAAQGVAIAASYHCPHRPDEGCACRKPGTALLERARDELGADLSASWVIGDQPSDLELARRAGCRAVYVQSGQGSERRAEPPGEIASASDLVAAAELVLAER